MPRNCDVFFDLYQKRNGNKNEYIYIYTHPKTNIDAQNDGPWKR